MIDIQQHAGPPRGYRLATELRLAADLDEVFAFFSDAHQLETLTPKFLNFSVLTPKPIDLREGTVIDYKLRVRGVPLRWRSKICQWDPPHRFVDEQLRGPYRRWHHLHTFEAVDNGTLCRDVVDYAVWGGPLVHALLVRRDLQKIFAYRTKVLADIFGPGPPPTAGSC